MYNLNVDAKIWSRKDNVMSKSLPDFIVIADGDCWKFQIVLVFHTEVNVLRMWQKMNEFGRNKQCEESSETQD